MKTTTILCLIFLFIGCSNTTKLKPDLLPQTIDGFLILHSINTNRIFYAKISEIQYVEHCKKGSRIIMANDDGLPVYETPAEIAEMLKEK